MTVRLAITATLACVACMTAATMSAGASDSMWFRKEHIPSYGVSPLFIKDSDRFSHGLKERIPVGGIRPSVAYMLTLLTDLSK